MVTSAAILVFAKAPVPGEVKTRLIPALGAEGAAWLHTALVERALTTARATGARVELCGAPDTAHPFFVECAEDFDVDLAAQGEGDLGARMRRALERALAAHDRVVIIGADCPAFDKKLLRRALSMLDAQEVVLTPAEDGGYALIGARRTHPAMFDGIDWGTDTVLARQRESLLACGLGFAETETLWDVDRPEDLPRLRTLKPPLEFFWEI